MLSFITDIYSKFQAFMTNWKIWQIVLFALSVPIVALVIQIFAYSARYVYARAYSRLKRFLKRNSYLSSSNIFSFNKKVVSVFPKNIKKQTKHIAESGMPVEEYINTFGFCYNVSKKSIVGAVAIAHTILLGIIVAMNTGAVGIVCGAVIVMAVVWLMAAAVDRLIVGAFAITDKRYRKKFITKLDSNTLLQEKQVDLTIPDCDEDFDDSALELAKSVEDFLASEPDKSIAKVVLKGLYSAKFSSAMSCQNKARLKNVVVELKNYVG